MKNESISNKKCIITIQKKRKAKQLIKALFNAELIEIAQLRKVTDFYNLIYKEKRVPFKVNEYEIEFNYDELCKKYKEQSIQDRIDLFKNICNQFNANFVLI